MAKASPSVSAGRTRSSSRGGRRRISRAQIAAEALKIVDEEGVAALTMRRLADAVGVGTMTIYGYFRDKDELLDAAIDAASGQGSLTTTGPWRDRLEQLITVVWKALERHSALVSVRLMRPVVRPDAMRFGEEGMAILRQAGFGAAEAAALFRLLFTYAFGFAALSPSARTQEARRRTDVAIAGLEPDQFPHLHAARAEFVEAVSGPEAFHAGLACILDGIEARLAATAGPAIRPA